MHHGDARTSESGDRAFAEAVLSGEWEESPQQLQTLLRYAVKLTREPWTMSRADIDGLRSVGLDDRAIVDTN